MLEKQFEKLKEEKATLLAEIEAKRQEYDESYIALLHQQQKTEELSKEYQELVKQMDSFADDVPEELKEKWQKEENQAKMDEYKEKATSMAQTGIDKVGEGLGFLGSKIGSAFEKLGHTMQGKEDKEDEVEEDDQVEEPSEEKTEDQ